MVENRGMQQTRRRILQTGTGGIMAGLAGCSSFKRTLLGHQLAHQVTIANVRYSPLRLDLTVQDDSGKILLKKTLPDRIRSCPDQ